MKMFSAILAATLFALILISCPMPQGPGEINIPLGVTEEPETITVETDTSRDQGIYINEQGLKIDILSQEEDGDLVRCVQATAILRVAETVSIASRGRPAEPGVKALILGVREDGNPGVWEVHQDDAIHPATSDLDGKRRSRLPRVQSVDHMIRAFFGWSYHADLLLTDGKGNYIILGYAENEQGFDWGRWTIDPGTRVALYWKVKKSSHGHFFVVYPAQVIGVPAEYPYQYRNEFGMAQGRGHSHRSRWSRFSHFLTSIRLFFLDWFETYLTGIEEAFYDEKQDWFVVIGGDQDDLPAEAHIMLGWRDSVTIEPISGPVETVDLTVASLVVPADAQWKNDTWELRATVQNTGSEASPESSFAFYYNRENTLSGAVEIATLPVPELAAGESTEIVYTNNAVPGSVILPSGTLYLLAVADVKDEIAELDEGNNLKSAELEILYERLVIDTYFPDGKGGFVDTFLSLFASSGDPDEDDPWTGSDAPPDALAEDDDGVPNYHYGYARIDYSGGLEPGIYYIRLRGADSADNGPYAIRALALDPGEILDIYPDVGVNGADPWEPPSDDNPVSTGGIPSAPVTITLDAAPLSRVLEPADIDWFKLEMP